MKTPPSGPGREIAFRLSSDDGTAVYHGHTVDEPFGLRAAFTEATPQIVRDLRARYHVRRRGRRRHAPPRHRRQ